MKRPQRYSNGRESGIQFSFITVDLQQDLTKAMDLARLVLVDVFGLAPDDKIKVYVSK